MKFRHVNWTAGFVLWSCLAQAATGAAQERQSMSLNGRWQLTADATTHDVDVPGTFERQVAPDFDGVGIYERSIDRIELPEHHRLLLRFAACATETTVWFDGVQVGSHLGAWTPFVLDVTDQARASPAGPWQLKVQVDEKVGHNTQGFLPVIQPHFGGLWQDVSLLVVPEIWIDPDRLLAIGEMSSSSVQLQIPIQTTLDKPEFQVEVQIQVPTGGGSSSSDSDPATWASLASLKVGKFANEVQPKGQAGFTWRDGKVTAGVLLDTSKLQSWSPDHPHRYLLKLVLKGPHSTDVVTTWFAFREFGTVRCSSFLNADLITLRGLLNWGYAPPLTSPTLDERRMRDEIEFAKSCGFNLMKFCLFIPPKRYLELCDELGMLAWIEYPTWHPQLTKEHLEPLRREYSEFFAYDRNHPCVILRSLTCETGSGAELDVIRSLYDLCKVEVPGAVVEDDSSWIEWNRVSDFYDDHPYGNNHTWRATLDRLDQYVMSHELKPLILGEAIAADTWTSPRRFDPSWTKSVAPHHLPRFLDDNARWLEQTGLNDEQLAAASLRYAMLTRKYQIETYRRIMRDQGYVVSVIRDFPLAGMGLIDYAGRPKWTVDDWEFHGETMLLLETEFDRRSFSDHDPIYGTLSVSHYGSEIIGPGSLKVQINLPNYASEHFDNETTFENVYLQPGTTPEKFSFAFAPQTVSKPTQTVVVACLVCGNRVFRNRWPLWIFPSAHRSVQLAAHPSIDTKRIDIPGVQWVSWLDRQPGQVICASRLDETLLSLAVDGESIWLLPDGQQGSFALEDHWFLRGGPAIFPAADRLFGPNDAESARQALVDLQHFDLANPVVPNIDSMLTQITPMVALWDNHDRSETRTHGLVFEVPVGRGRMVVSALDHSRPTNAAGRWLASKIVEYLEKPSAEGGSERANENAARLVAELTRNERELQSQDWRFHPDPKQEGQSLGWQGASFDDSDWTTIKADRHWEGQGHESLDGWAWYRLNVPLNGDWAKAEKLYLNFTGVDDHYQLYINGHWVGSGGDVATKKTAFDERKSYDITDWAKSSDSIQIAVAVYDWFGAGGIFRPVTLSTQPLSDDLPWLK